ncbi:MAG: MlaD family protein [Tannerella sp.]|jgi:phospholipid/cholesterol/gamma-HCH transport system substrate-binding protein|nr:MlaD family protein [Tannerella sp.]
MKRFSKETVIGLVSIISLALLYVGVNYLKGVNLFKPANYYYVSCTNVREITISSPVFVEGFRIGLVREIRYDYSSTDRITLEISLDKGMKINRGSYISIESTLLSGAELHLKLNSFSGEYYKAGDTLEGRLKGGMMASVENELLPRLIDMMPKIDSILAGLQTLVHNPALSQSLDNIESTTGQLAASSKKLNVLLGNDVPEIASNLKTASANLSVFSSDLNRLGLDRSINSLNSSLEHINALTLRLNANDNTLGLLLNDSLLYRNLNNTLDNASGLLLDFKQNPKRYVRFSLF